jgi:hypothetical protein
MLVSRRSSRICTKTSGLDLPPADPSEAMKTYFEKCDEKIGFVPHVLRVCGVLQRPCARTLGTVEA